VVKVARARMITGCVRIRAVGFRGEALGAAQKAGRVTARSPADGATSDIGACGAFRLMIRRRSASGLAQQRAERVAARQWSLHDVGASVDVPPQAGRGPCPVAVPAAGRRSQVLMRRTQTFTNAPMAGLL
jgi:hypothetical protein